MQRACVFTRDFMRYYCAAQVAAPTWATSTAPAPAPAAPAVGIQFIMTGVSVAQLNQTQLRCARFAPHRSLVVAPRLCMHDPSFIALI